MRFTRRQHLRSAADFSEVRASGNRRECGFFYAHFRKDTDRQPPLRRVGVIASRRVGNAVHRNRAKRLLRELFRQNQDRLPASCELILVARRSILTASFEDLERKFKGMIKTLNHPAQ